MMKTIKRQKTRPNTKMMYFYLLLSMLLIAPSFILIVPIPSGTPWPICKKLPKQPPVNQPLVSSLRIYSDIIDIV